MIGNVYITDRIKNPTIEEQVLAEYLTDNPNDHIEVLLVWHQNITEEYLEQFPNVHTVIRYGVGYDKIDVQACLRKGITVCNNPDYCTDEVSDTALAMILNCSREITRYDAVSRFYTNGWQENVNKNISRNSETLIGFVGVGRIGSLTLKKAKYLGYQTCFYDPYASYGVAKVFETKRMNSLEELLGSCDIVSLHCPSNSETLGMVDDVFIDQMKSGASLVNTARGNLVKDLSVIERGLKSNKLNMACLDVLPQEPPLDDSLIQAWKNHESWVSGRLVINPHSSYNSIQSEIEQRYKASENALTSLLDRNPKYVVHQPLLKEEHEVV
ncbi:NAD(P)-dependent oxidoreductase [uncultured Aquimarina sp.]|uniref:NAD(P)-dependent oxidoreductase n=1 Tax=uncultured Aquimarina sp. TaxID=575652 RepID=UPI0026119648|nr:NAD(P)-dependent oxidoreductase [uncultured Aquimarina sp.]